MKSKSHPWSSKGMKSNTAYYEFFYSFNSRTSQQQQQIEVGISCSERKISLRWGDEERQTNWRQFYLLHFNVPLSRLPCQCHRYLNNFARFHCNHRYSCMCRSHQCLYKARSCHRDSHLAHTHPHLLRGRHIIFDIKEPWICQVKRLHTSPCQPDALIKSSEIPSDIWNWAP